MTGNNSLLKHHSFSFALVLVKGFDQDAISAIESYDWPGNVRELESRVKRATIMADGNYISPEDLELSAGSSDDAPLNMKAVREAAERKAILRAMEHCDNNVSEAATLLGITRPTLYSLIEKLGIKQS